MTMLVALSATGMMLSNPLAQISDQDPEKLMALLEFLADWETQDGEWVDPEDMSEVVDAQPTIEWSDKEVTR